MMNPNHHNESHRQNGGQVQSKQAAAMHSMAAHTLHGAPLPSGQPNVVEPPIAKSDLLAKFWRQVPSQMAHYLNTSSQSPTTLIQTMDVVIRTTAANLKIDCRWKMTDAQSGKVGFVGNIQTLTLLSHIAQGESKTFELQLQLKTASSGGYEVFNDAPLVRFIHNWDPSGKIECQLLVRKPFEGENDIPYSFPLPGIEEKGFLILVYKGPQYVNNKDLTPQDLESVKRAVGKISNLVWKCERCKKVFHSLKEAVLHLREHTYSPTTFPRIQVERIAERDYPAKTIWWFRVKNYEMDS